jgi:hypothetical protein
METLVRDRSKKRVGENVKPSQFSAEIIYAQFLNFAPCFAFRMSLSFEL